MEKFRKCKQCFYLYSVFHFRSVLKIVIILAIICVRVAFCGVFRVRFVVIFGVSSKAILKGPKTFVGVTVNCQNSGKLEALY